MIRVTIKGSEELQKIMDQMPNRMLLAFVRGMRDTAIDIQSTAKKNAPVWRGLLRESIVQSVTVDGNKIVGVVGSAVPYARILEFGSDGGGRFPNVETLKVWARRKLGDERAAYVIGRAIQRRGFTPQPYLAPALEEVGPRAQFVFTNRILEALREVR